MKNFIITLNGYGLLLKELFRSKPLFEYADKSNFQNLSEKGRWGYIHLGKTLEKSYFNLFANETDFPGEAFLRSLVSKKLPDGLKTFFLAEFLTHIEGKVIETDLIFSDKELNQLLMTVSEDKTGFSYDICDGKVVVGYKERFPSKSMVFPPSLKNRKFKDYLYKEKEFKKINNLILKSSTTLYEHPINQIRLDLGEPIGNLFWLWGMGEKKDVYQFSERMERKSFFISFNDDLQGVPEYLGFEKIPEISFYEDDSILWINNSLDINQERSLWVKSFEKFDSEVLGYVRSLCSNDDYRILFIFDSFSQQNRVLTNQWGVYCFMTNVSPKPLRFRKHIKNGKMFIEKFFI